MMKMVIISRDMVGRMEEEEEEEKEEKEEKEAAAVHFQQRWW